MTGQQLKNSILQMAVQGKLVPQDPNDEPASVLLARIREEKEQLIKDGKIKKEKNPSQIFRGENGRFYERIGKAEPVCIDEELPFEIPESWEWARLESISYLVGNKHNQILSKEVLSEGALPVVSQSQNLIDGYTNFVDKKISELPLIMFGDHTRNVKYIDFEFVIGADGTKFHKIILSHEKYIYFWMLNAANSLKNRAYARHYSLLKNCYIPLPPLAEQQRIVAKIEELMPFVDRYNELEKQLEALNTDFPDQLKKSILQYAIQGKLVPQDPADEPASALLERIRAEKEQLIKEGKIKREKNPSHIYRGDDGHFYERIGNNELTCIDDQLPFEIPETWEWCRLGAILTSTEAGKSPQCDDRPRTGEKWGVIKTTAIQDGYFLSDQNKVLPNNFNVQNSMIIHQGDLLITRAGPRNRTGVICIVEENPKNLILSDKTVRLSYLRGFLDPKYVMLALSTPAMQDIISQSMTGMAASQVNISQSKMKTFLLPLPPLAEQQRIVEKLEQILSLCEHLTERV